MNQILSQQDIDRRIRLQEWFKSDPDIWADFTEEFKSYHHNEMIQLKSRTCLNREWSSGFASAIEEVLSMGDYLRKSWTAPKVDKKSQKQM